MPIRNQNLIGKHFGHLTVIAKSKERGTQNEYKWVCQCDCGNKTVVTTSRLNNGTTTSCGHVKMEKSKVNLKHTEESHLKQLNNRLPKNNKTGYKNISITYRNGKKKYRVSIQYNRKQHSALRDTLDEAIRTREELRKQYWPNYKKQKDKKKNMIPTHKIENWRNSRGSGLDRARALITDTANDLQEISNKTGIPYQSLKNLRSNPEKISKMSWERANKLSQLYDIYEIQNNMPLDKANELLEDIQEMFNMLRGEAETNSENAIIDSCEDIIISDPVAVYQVYQNLHK